MQRQALDAVQESRGDGDLENTADIPIVGSSRVRAMQPRPRVSTSSLGSAAASAAMPPPHQASSSRVPLRLHNIADTEVPSTSQSVHSGRAYSEVPNRRIKPRKTDEVPTASTTARPGRTRAYSSSSRALWSSAASARAESVSDARSHDRIAHWREQHAQALESEAVDKAHSRTPAAMSASRAAFARRKHAREEPTLSAETPMRSVLRYLSQEELSNTAVWWLGLAVAILVRSLVSLGGWSGRNKPPMYGDFEAQRHWIELTWHLPTERWYRYDLPYWGLDYPPLTAWTSWACAWVAMWFKPLRAAFALRTSRGNESSSVVVFMRLSVLVLDLFVYLPAVAYFLARRLETRSARVRHIALFTLWCQPALILIDHGHFQYNGVMLGLAAMSFALLQSKLPNLHARMQGPAIATAELQRLVLDTLSRHTSLQYVAAAVFFSLSLCFKQMALYYAPAVFAVMLGRCVGLLRHHWSRGLALFAGLGGATLATFALLFLPWLSRRTELEQVVHRIFPLARGLFEDKVANVWCALSVLPVGPWKLQRMFAVETLAKLSILTVLIAILPTCILLFITSIEGVRRESILDDAQAEQVVAKVRRRAGSVASQPHYRRMPPSVREGSYARSVAPSAHDSSRGSDRHSVASGSIFAGSTSTLMRDVPRASATAIVPTTPRPSSTPSPAAELLPYTLASTALAFFLFGFQTHEKSILLPLLPLTMLMTSKGDRTGAGAMAADWEWSVLANNVGMFSMWPLLVRDGQGLAWCVLFVVWNGMIGYRPWEALKTTRATYVAWLSAAVHVCMLGLLALELLVGILALAGRVPPLFGTLLSRYPDLFPVLNVLLCTPTFLLVWLWSLKKHVEIALASGVLDISKSRM